MLIWLKKFWLSEKEGKHMVKRSSANSTSENKNNHTIAYWAGGAVSGLGDKQ